MKTIRFHRLAQAELTGAALYYASVSTRVAERFVAAVEDAVGLAAEFPEMGSPHTHGTRRVFPRGFRFSVVYVSNREDLYVVAVASFSRAPDYWRSRSREP